MAETCEPCKSPSTCLTFPLIFYSLSNGKSYSNDPMIFHVTCPNGTVVDVTIEAGEITFTLPFPPEFTGEYPPLVLPCEGGVIIRNIPSGATQTDIDTIVAGMFQICGQAKAQNRACSVTFGNDQVTFDIGCAVGETAHFTGTLPSWVTLDDVNNQLVGAAGTFSGTSVASATSTAQSALDTFGNQQITLGNLACSSGPPCIAQVDSIPVVFIDPDGLTPTNSAGTRRMLVNDTATPELKFIDTSTDTVINTVGLPFTLANGCFASSTQTFFLGNGTLTAVRVYDKDGNFITDIVLPNGTTVVVYSPVQDRVYACYVNINTHFAIINPHTNTIVGDIDTGIAFGNPPINAYFPESIASQALGSRWNIFNLPAGTFQGFIDLSPGGYTNAFAYAANTGKIFVGAFNSITFNAEVWEIDPATLLVTHTYAMTDTGDTINGLAYNPITGAILASGSFDGNTTVIDPVNHVIVCDVALVPFVTGSSTQCDYVSGQVYRASTGNGDVLVLA